MSEKKKPAFPNYSLTKEDWLEHLLGVKMKGLTPFHKQVGTVFFLYTDRQHFYSTGELHSYPSLKKIAEVVGATETGVRKAVAQLRKAGVLSLAQEASRGRHANRYQLIVRVVRTRSPLLGVDGGVGGSTPNEEGSTDNEEDDNPTQRTSEPVTGKKQTLHKPVAAKRGNAKALNHVNTVERAALTPLVPAGHGDATRAKHSVESLTQILFLLTTNPDLLKLAKEAHRNLYDEDRQYNDACSCLKDALGTNYRLLSALLFATHSLPEANTVARRAAAIAAKHDEAAAARRVVAALADALGEDALVPRLAEALRAVCM